MKKTLALVMVLVLALAFAACGGNGSETTVPSTAPTTEPTTVPTTEPTTVPTTEPAPTASVGNIDLTGMTLEDAKAALTEAAAAYKLSLTVNGKPMAFTAEELCLKLDDAALAALLHDVAIMMALMMPPWPLCWMPSQTAPRAPTPSLLTTAMP